MLKKKLYRIGDSVPEDGEYECVACGNSVFYKKGEIFNRCDECRAGTQNGPAGYDSPEAEFWKKVM